MERKQQAMGEYDYPEVRTEAPTSGNPPETSSRTMNPTSIYTNRNLCNATEGAQPKTGLQPQPLVNREQNKQRDAPSDRSRGSPWTDSMEPSGGRGEGPNPSRDATDALKPDCSPLSRKSLTACDDTTWYLHLPKRWHESIKITL